ncbi:MAG: PP0621 family protein [Burkholderiales bacterium]|nr:PP0621 family protein [Burkholderiales bacterium]
MAKILLIVIAFAAAFWLLRSHRRRARRNVQSPTAPQAEDMVGCAQCGVHLPRREGIKSGDRYFCSDDHEREFRDNFRDEH